jgi:hypothetical protein
MASAAKPDLASALWPSLSRDAKAKAAQEAKAREELKARLQRTKDNLQATIDAVRREKGSTTT